MATTTAIEAVTAEAVLEPALSLTAQFRKFLWVSSGLFSTSSLALAFLDYFAASALQRAGTHFLAAVAAAALFAAATVLKFGPDEA